MLRVDLRDAMNATTMKVEGRLTDTFANEVKSLVMQSKIAARLVVNVSELTFVDEVGEAVLGWLGRAGAEFVAENSYSRHICERLRLPLAPDPMTCSFRGSSALRSREE